jgi:hypothetical protein
MNTSRYIRTLPVLLLMVASTLRLDAQQIADGGDAYFKVRFGGRSQEMVKLLKNQPNVGPRNIAFLINPMTCPRCEGLAYEIMSRVEHDAGKGANFCVVSYPRLVSVVDYVQKRRFPVRTILDTTGTLFNELGLDQAPPFVTVWDSSGVLLYAKALYGVNVDDSTFWNDMRTATAHQESASARRTAITVGMADVPSEWRTPTISFRRVLEEDSTSLLSAVSYPSIDLSRNLLAMMDNLSLTIKLYDLKSGRHLRDLAPDYPLRKMFSDDVGRTDFLNMERFGVAHTMFFGTNFSGDTIFVSASLPEIREEHVRYPNGELGQHLAYRNVASIVKYSIRSGKMLGVTRIETMVDSGLNVSHAATPPVYNRRKGELALITGKGYPYTGTSTAAAMGKGNPTRREFYDNTPLFLTFDLETGRYKRRLGTLDTINRSLGIGYALASPRIAFDDRDHYIVQNPSSQVITGSGRRIDLKSYFNPHITGNAVWHDSIPSIDEIAYLADSCGARITQLAAAKGKLYVVWHIKRSDVPFRKGYHILVQQYSTADGKLRHEWNIPQNTEDGKAADMGIDPTAGVAVCIYQTSMFSTAVGYRLK